MKTTQTLRETIAFLSLALVAFILGICGYAHYRPELGCTDHIIDSVKLFFSFSFNYAKDLTTPIPLVLNTARWLALIATFIAILKTYTLIAQAHKDRLWLMLPWVKNHLVVCGLGEHGYCMTMVLLNQAKTRPRGWAARALHYLPAFLRPKGKTIVVIEADPNNPHLATVRAAGARVIIGDATSNIMLRTAQIQKAAKTHIMLGNDNKVIAAAITCRNIVAKSRKKQRPPLECYAHMQRPHGKKFFKVHDLFSSSKKSETFDPKIIDDNLLSAQQLLLAYAGKMLAPARTSPTPPRIVVAGAGCIGQNLLLQMAHILHPGSKKLLDVTLVDIQAAKREKEFYTRYPFMLPPSKNKTPATDAATDDAAATDANADADAAPAPGSKPGEPLFVTPRFVHGDITLCDDALMNEIRGDAANPIHGVFLCIGNETDELAAALLLRRHLNDDQIPIVVCADSASGLSDLLKVEAVKDPDWKNISIHNLTKLACEQFGPNGEAIETMAKALHEEWRELDLKQNRPALPWDDLPDHEKESSRNQAYNLLLNLKNYGYEYRLAPNPPLLAGQFYAPEDLPLLGDMEHRRWMIEKFLNGWKYGETKDPDKKLNPYLQPSENLDSDTRKKDTKPIESTLRLLQASGYAVQKAPPKQ